jgi:hypothetical protein
VKTIEIDQELLALLMARAQSPQESPSAILRRELAIAPPLVTLDIEDEVYRYLAGRAVDVGESASSILRRELKRDGHGDHPPIDPDHGALIVEFRIPRGIGPGAWNTRDQMVRAKVGDTLRLFNDDTVPHRLHTGGSPFPHPGDDIGPGQAGDFVLRTPFDPDVNPPLYDHVHGPGAPFWIAVRP